MKKITKLLSLIILLMVINKVTVAQWTLEPFTPGRTLLTGAANKKAAIFYGGINSNFSTSPRSNHVNIYDLTTHTWVVGARTGKGRSNLTSTSLGPRIYIAGGYAGFDFGGSQNEINIYNTDSAKWQANKTLCIPRSDLASAAAGSKVLFAGGLWNSTTEIEIDSVDIFDTLTGSHTVQHLSIARHGLCGASSGNIILFAGGRINGTVSAPTKRVDLYNVCTGTWSIDSLSQARTNAVAVSSGTKIYIAGGQTGIAFATATASKVIDIYDVETKIWTTDSLSIGRTYLTGAATNNFVLFAGGTGKENLSTGAVSPYYNTAEIYNVTTNAWSVTSLNKSRGTAAAVAIDDKFFVAGGSESSLGLLGNMDSYQLPASTPVPTGVTISITNCTYTSVTIGWTSSLTSNTLRYRKIGDCNWIDTTITGSTFTITGLTANTNYETQVRANSATAGFSDFSGIKNFSTLILGPASVPTGLAVSNITNSGANLKWNLIPNASSYALQYKTAAASTWTTVANITTNSYSLAGLSPCLNYQVAVKAKNTCDSSAYSSTVSFSTISPVTVPTGLAVSSITNTGANLNWNLTPNAISYTLQYKIVTASTWTTVQNITTNSYSLAGLTLCTNYQVAVKAKSNCDSSAYGTTVAFSTKGTVTIPTGLAVSNITSTGANLNWNLTTDASTYTLQYKIATASTWTTIPNLTTNSYSLAGLTLCSNYQVEVKAKSTCDSSVYSNTFSFSTIGAVNVPTGLAVSNITGTSADIDWALTPDASSYAIQYKETAASTWTTVHNITTNSYSLSGLTANTNYEVAVKAKSVCDSSAYSTAESFLTAGPNSVDHVNKGEQFSIFPNPASDVITLTSAESKEKGEIKILNNLGQVVYNRELPVNTASFNINIEQLPNGFYTISYFNGNANSMKKFVKE